MVNSFIPLCLRLDVRLSGCYIPHLKKQKKQKTKPQVRFGIGEWYGRPFNTLTHAQRKELAAIQSLPKAQRPFLPCPFKSEDLTIPCNKPGGTCSFRLYERSRLTGEVKLVEGEQGALRTFCPNRFEDAHLIYRWVGETLLRCPEPVVLNEIGFLESPPTEMQEEEAADSVGRIDNVLVAPGSQPLTWCALEVQAVYFSGKGMKDEFEAIMTHPDDTIPFPVYIRRPDYRSSGPKRLMPQLQIKVPSLRRWGKKMAVVVDRSFFQALGKMRTVPHLSNSDVAWFVVKYDETAGRNRLIPDMIQFTTLEDSVEGLTAGVPVSADIFEDRIQTKLNRLARPAKIPPNQ